MATRFGPVQLAFCAAALGLGVLIGRTLPRSESTAAHGGAKNPMAEAGQPVHVESPADTAGKEVTPASAKSLGAILAARNDRERLRELQEFISALEARDYAHTLKSIRQIPHYNERELISRLLVATWAATDPDGALHFAAATRGFEYVAEDVFRNLAASDAEAALVRARAIPGNELRSAALRGLLANMADADPAGALRLAQTFGEIRGNEPLSSLVYKQWAANDPQAAAAQAAQDPQPGRGWLTPIGEVLNQWGWTDPRAAAAWALTLPPHMHGRYVADVSRQWGREDAEAAANWVRQLPPGDSQDAAVTGLAQSMISTDLPAALGWIAAIPEEAARNRALRRISREVLHNDPGNGAATLQAAGVPAALIEQARAIPDGP